MGLAAAHQTRQADKLIEDLQLPVRELTKRVEQLEADEFSFVSPIPFASASNTNVLTTAYTSTIRANGLGINGSLHAHYTLLILNNTGGSLNLQTFIVLNATTIFSPTFSIGTSAAGRTIITIDYYLTNINSASIQRNIMRVASTSATNASTLATETVQAMFANSSIDTSLDTTLLIQHQMASASANFQWLMVNGILTGPLKAS